MLINVIKTFFLSSLVVCLNKLLLVKYMIDIF